MEAFLCKILNSCLIIENIEFPTKRFESNTKFNNGKLLYSLVI